MIIPFLAGAVTLGFAISALFFLRFWRRTRDQLFLAFATAFAVLGIGQAFITFAHSDQEENAAVYLLRLSAFTVIIIAITMKNRGRRG
jgi:membrane-associated PAP2 superfamily phosphatase